MVSNNMSTVLKIVVKDNMSRELVKIVHRIFVVVARDT
jgi:hypothetical protein